MRIRICIHIEAACSHDRGRQALGPGCDSRAGFQPIPAWRALRPALSTGIGSVALGFAPAARLAGPGYAYNSVAFHSGS